MNKLKMWIILLITNISIINISISQNTVKIKISGACGMCKDRIEEAASKVIGVTSVDYNLKKQELTVETESIFVKKELVSALLAVGHDTDGQKAEDAVYEVLHGCCHYRGDKVDKSGQNDHDHTEDDGHDHSDHDGHDHSADDGHDHSTGTFSNIITGTVFEKSENGALLPLIGANLRWLNNKSGTITDMNGKFEMPFGKKKDYLVVSYVGYSPDTILIEKAGNISVTISSPNLLDAIEIVHKKRSTEISYLETVKVHQISSKELLKAACCNLAESFDTTPAIDASSTDAITGTRKIEMLGLAGPYVQITRENMPDVRGLAALQGLAYTPGPWIEGMQLNMGAGSVVNGYESITGQINVEIKKPCHDERLHLNAYASQAARLEINTVMKQEINENWSTSSLLHLSNRGQRRDHNHDGFLDMPLGKQIGFINRWKWTNGQGQEGQLGMKLTFMDNISGQTEFDPLTSIRNQVWGADMTTNRAEVWAKRGIVNLDKPYKTLGFQASAVYHDQKSQFGLRRYDGTQKSLYFNMIYQSIINNTDHQVRMGTSFQYDNFHETVASKHFKRNELVPGIFGEYTYKGSEKFSLLVGGRADYHNNFGLFFTPRLNIRYAPEQSTVFRIAAGRGQKTASIFSENIGVFASNREIILEGTGNDKTPYGLNAEVAWNLGFSATKEIKLGKRLLNLSLDLNRIDFENQIVVDLDRSARQVVFYNLRGKSYSNSMQFQTEIDVFKWLDLRLAYRYNDVQTTYGEQLLQKPLISPERAFANVGIDAGKGWMIDYTINRLSSVRIPSTIANDEKHKWPEASPSYFLSNAQVSKKWKNNFEVYVGGENIFDYRLDQPIISAHAPFSQYFDSSLAWGPIMGVNIYAGVRYSLK
ncbi:MAG: TonB-dependent receptor [Saprospiraceae bacterium]